MTFDFWFIVFDCVDDGSGFEVALQRNFLTVYVKYTVDVYMRYEEI